MNLVGFGMDADPWVDEGEGDGESGGGGCQEYG